MKFNSLTPNFSVRDVRETITFYKDVLEFKLEMVVPDGSTQIETIISEGAEYAYAMMSKDGIYVMFLKLKFRSSFYPQKRLRNIDL